MNNLNKYTKAELISKFKRLENKSSNNNNNTTQNTPLFQKIIESVILLKNIILKLTIISLLVKYLKNIPYLKKYMVNSNLSFILLF